VRLQSQPVVIINIFQVSSAIGDAQLQLNVWVAHPNAGKAGMRMLATAHRCRLSQPRGLVWVIGLTRRFNVIELGE
jgi:hypothetical protein